MYTLEEWLSELEDCSSGFHVGTEITDEYVLLKFMDGVYMTGADGEPEFSDEFIKYGLAISMAEFGKDDWELFDRCVDVLREVERDARQRFYERQTGGQG